MSKFDFLVPPVIRLPKAFPPLDPRISLHAFPTATLYDRCTIRFYIEPIFVVVAEIQSFAQHITEAILQ